MCAILKDEAEIILKKKKGTEKDKNDQMQRASCKE